MVAENSPVTAKMASHPWFGEFLASMRKGGPWQPYPMIMVTRDDISKASGDGRFWSSSRVGVRRR
jgi:hypothetical protein